MEQIDQPERARPCLVCRGVRGATIASGDSREEIHAATRELVIEIIRANGIETDDLASAFFTTSADLTAAYPAEAARLMGWEYVPMLGAVEMDKQGGPARCIRVMLLWNTTMGPREIKHIYLKGTESLRTVGERTDEGRMTKDEGRRTKDEGRMTTDDRRPTTDDRRMTNDG